MSSLTGSQTCSAANKRGFDSWTITQLQSALANEKTPDPCFLNVMAGARIPPQTALAEAKEMLSPGTDSTSVTLAHTLYAISSNQAFQDELASDIAASEWPTDMSSLEAIPSLVACVKEGIRWTGAATAMLPRVVPKGGALVEGAELPGGTKVSSSPAWYLHHETAFPDPERYRPSRWLEQRNERNPLDEYYIPFSKGPSTCIGVHFVYLELYLSVSQILRKYRIRPRSGNNLLADHEAVLPSRGEWATAAPLQRLEVTPEERWSSDVN
ncbi:unnamed protein product [Penicillium olsonii]|nr:unnamed protein product [Penicillium olsonii]